MGFVKPENIKSEKVHMLLEFIIVNVFCIIFQSVILIGMGIVQFITWFISGGNNIISYAVIIIIYAVVWFVFWRILFEYAVRCFRWFYIIVIFSVIPIILALWLFNPIQTNPLPMITMPLEPEFSSLVAGIILFPLYSISIYKFILQSNKHKNRNAVFLCAAMLLLGSGIFVISWRNMYLFYK